MTQPADTNLQLAFDSTTLPPEERFPRYREMYQGGADAIQIADDIHALVKAWRLDRALLFHRRIAGLEHRRTARRAGHDGFDHFTLTMVLAGDWALDIGDGFVPVGAGQAVLADMLKPMRNRAIDAEIVTFSMARENLARISADPDELHGYVVAGPGAALLGDFARSLIAQLDAIDAPGRSAVTGAIRKLLSIGLEPHNRGRDVGTNIHAARRNRLRAVIDQLIVEGRLDPAAIIEASGLSRATIYRLLQDDGGLRPFMLARQLERVRWLLDDPRDDTPLEHVAQAAGFASASHCSRAFEAAFGCRPGEYRDVVREAERRHDPTPRMRAWEDEIR